MNSELETSRLQLELLKRGYSLEEIEHIYALGRIYLESGNLRQASLIFDGLADIVPTFLPAALAQSVIALFERNYSEAMKAAKRALGSNAQSIEATLLLVIAMLGLEDYNSAGTYLGEVREAIEAGTLREKNLVRIYKMLLARYRTRL